MNRDDRRPNILLIMCDQLRADVLGCYGNSFVKTPNIDRLAATGMVFDRAYSLTPVCMPARHALISGKPAFEIGMIDNGQEVRPIAHPLPEVIRQQGYATFAVGKMHFHPVRKHYGFDRMFLSEEIPGHFYDDDYLQFLHQNGYGHVQEPHGKRSEMYYVPQKSELPEELHTTAWTADRTCEVIRKNRNRPFFLFASFIKPHPPFDPCEPYDKMYPLEDIPMPICREEEKQPDDYSIDVQNDYKVGGIDNVSEEDIRKIRSYYYGCVSQIDKQIGKILDELEANGLLENTLVIFTSDHGEMLGDHYAFGKRTFYEASARIPLIVSWPGKIPAGERSSEFAVLQDIYATCITVAGGVVPEDSIGKNLVAMAQGNGEPPREKIIGEFGTGRALKFMLRWGDFKYIYHTNGALEQLFDLKNDPHELNNIAALHPDICRQARMGLVEYYRRRGFHEALDGDQLKRYPFERHVPKGYLDQFPRWPETVVRE